MAKYKQGYNDRLDESLGMRKGKESGKSQSYKSRRDESRGMSKSSMPKDLGHDSKVYQCNAFAAQKQGMSGLRERPNMDRGYPKKAYDYKY